MAIIHENTRLTRYLITVIKKVHTKNSNLDIPNNMRQVGVARVGVALSCVGFVPPEVV